MANRRYNCGETFPSSCSPYQGPALTFITEAEAGAFPCDANLDDVFKLYNKYVTILVDGNDFSELDPGDFGFTPATATAKDLHAIELTAIAELQAELEVLTTTVNELNIGESVIELDLECMADDASDCAVGTNQYQLINILTLFKNKLCDFETRISNLE